MRSFSRYPRRIAHRKAPTQCDYGASAERGGHVAVDDHPPRQGRSAACKHQGVYAVGRADLRPEGEFLAAALAIGEAAVVSHFAAAFLWGFWSKFPDGLVDVTVPRRVRSRKRTRVHMAQTPRTDVAWCRRVPITNPARTLVDLETFLRSDNALRRTVHEAESMRLVSPVRIRAQLQRTPNERLSALVADGPRPTRSALEDAVDELLTRNGLRPPQTNVIVAGLSTSFTPSRAGDRG